MGNKNPQLRQLKLASLDAIINDINNLQKRGYTSVGNWTLGQTCGHLAEWMRYPIDGFPTPPIFIRPIMWLMKVTIAKSMKKKILAEGFKPGTPTAPDSVPDESVSDEEQIAFLVETIERLKNHEGSLHPSPLFGPMDKEMLTTVSLLHAEHHLRFLLPKR